MKKLLAVLKMLVAPVVWAFNWVKSWFKKAEPTLAADVKAAAAGAPAKASWAWGGLKMLGAGFVVIGKALVSLKLWTRVAVVTVFAAMLAGAWLNGHHVGHGAVPGLVDEVQTLTKENASLRVQVAGLKADLAKAVSVPKAEPPMPVAAAEKRSGHTSPASAQRSKKPAPAKDWYSGIIPGM